VTLAVQVDPWGIFKNCGLANYFKFQIGLFYAKAVHSYQALDLVNHPT